MQAVFDRFFFPTDKGEIREIKVGVIGSNAGLTMQAANNDIHPKLKGLGESLRGRGEISDDAWLRKEIALDIPTSGVTGASMVLPAALAYLQAMCGRDPARPRRIIVATGDLKNSSELDGWGALLPVNGMEGKLDGIQEKSDGVLASEERHFIYCSDEITPRISDRLARLEKQGWRLRSARNFDDLREFWKYSEKSTDDAEPEGEPAKPAPAQNNRKLALRGLAGAAAALVIGVAALKLLDPGDPPPLSFDGALRIDVAEQRPDGSLRAWAADGKRFASSARLMIRLRYEGRAEHVVALLTERSPEGLRPVASLVLGDDDGFIERLASDLSRADGEIVLVAAECGEPDCAQERDGLLSLEAPQAEAEASLSTPLKSMTPRTPLVASVPIDIL